MSDWTDTGTLTTNGSTYIKNTQVYTVKKKKKKKKKKHSKLFATQCDFQAEVLTMMMFSDKLSSTMIAHGKHVDDVCW